jgi:hypothetical protein
MASSIEATSLLQEGLGIEKLAEENCEKLLKEFKLNGFAEKVEHIKNDEIHHQAMVQKLLSFL